MTNLTNLANPTLENPPSSSSFLKLLRSPYLLLSLFAILSGFLISRFLPIFPANRSQTKTPNGEKPISAEEITSESDIKVGVSYGQVGQAFKDSAEGVLEKGGIDGEGTHHLVREGGPSQTAYLTSSVLDLDLFVGKKIKVEGETFAAQKAGWLMDVGLVTPLK